MVGCGSAAGPAIAAARSKGREGAAGRPCRWRQADWDWGWRQRGPVSFLFWAVEPRSGWRERGVWPASAPHRSVGHQRDGAQPAGGQGQGRRTTLEAAADGPQARAPEASRWGLKLLARLRRGAGAQDLTRTTVGVNAVATSVQGGNLKWHRGGVAGLPVWAFRRKTIGVAERPAQLRPSTHATWRGEQGSDPLGGGLERPLNAGLQGPQFAAVADSMMASPRR